MPEDTTFPDAIQFRKIIVVASDHGHGNKWSNAVLQATQDRMPRVIPVTCQTLDQAASYVQECGPRLLGLVYDHSNGGPLEIQRLHEILANSKAWRIVRRASTSPQVEPFEPLQYGINRLVNGTHDVPKMIELIRELHVLESH